MKKKAYNEIIEILERVYPETGIMLSYSNAFELLIATILSAQCTDERVNMVTKVLFSVLSTPEDFAQANQEEIEKLIFSTGFYKAKAKNIIAASRMLVDEHGGKVPGTIEELTRLPGVGRKTANVVLGHIFGVPSVVVDTHVGRLAFRMGITKSLNPEIAERDIMAALPRENWTAINHLLIAHGRRVCTSRIAKCKECPVEELCPKHDEKAVKPQRSK